MGRPVRSPAAVAIIIICLAMAAELMIAAKATTVPQLALSDIHGVAGGVLDHHEEYLFTRGDDVAEGPSSRKVTLTTYKRRTRYHNDKSEIGGGVIVGGLVSVFFAVLYFYIRSTRRGHGNNTASGNLPK